MFLVIVLSYFLNLQDSPVICDFCLIANSCKFEVIVAFSDNLRVFSYFKFVNSFLVIYPKNVQRFNNIRVFEKNYALGSFPDFWLILGFPVISNCQHISAINFSLLSLDIFHSGYPCSRYKFYQNFFTLLEVEKRLISLYDAFSSSGFPVQGLDQLISFRIEKLFRMSVIQVFGQIY